MMNAHELLENPMNLADLTAAVGARAKSAFAPSAPAVAGAGSADKLFYAASGAFLTLQSDSTDDGADSSSFKVQPLAATRDRIMLV
jgi:hypothetical protein